jgi:hypothetical protein
LEVGKIASVYKKGCAQLSLELRKELKVVVLVGGEEFHHNPLWHVRDGDNHSNFK